MLIMQKYNQIISIRKSIFFSIILTFGSLNLSAQEAQKKEKASEKISLGMGIGLNYGYAGFKINYQFANQFIAFAGVGINQLQPSLPVIGIEYFAYKKQESKFYPFVNLSTGKNFLIHLRDYGDSMFITNESEINSDRKTLITINTCAGIIYNLKEKRGVDLRLGISYRYFNAKNAQTFIDNFNEKYETDKSLKTNSILPVLGIRFDFNYLKKKLKKTT